MLTDRLESTLDSAGSALGTKVHGTSLGNLSLASGKALHDPGCYI